MPHVLVAEDVTGRDEALSLAGSRHGAPALDQPRHGAARADSRT